MDTRCPNYFPYVAPYSPCDVQLGRDIRFRAKTHPPRLASQSVHLGVSQKISIILIDLVLLFILDANLTDCLLTGTAPSLWTLLWLQFKQTKEACCYSLFGNEAYQVTWPGGTSTLTFSACFLSLSLSHTVWGQDSFECVILGCPFQPPASVKPFSCESSWCHACYVKTTSIRDFRTSGNLKGQILVYAIILLYLLYCEAPLHTSLSSW